MFEIITYGNPVLRKKAAKVDVFDDALREFVRELSECMIESDGIGLAAPQVGRSVRVVVIDPTGGEQAPQAYINPEIIWSSDDVGDYNEGCLSIPDINLNVKRPASVSVTAVGPDGGPFLVERAEGLLARALQHEIDHLDGILFVDRVSPLQRQLVNGKLKKLAKSQRATTQPA